MIRIACNQAPVKFGDPAHNADFAIDSIRKLASDGVQLVLFPEAFLTGYCVSDHEAAWGIAIESRHDSIRNIEAVCHETGVIAVVGFAEKDGKLLYNSAALIEPDRETRIYRKTHLPELGLDRFVIPGNEISVFETKLGKIGVLICFDMRYPEATRSLALQEADLICLPTNWPVGAECSAEHICIARAAENRVFFATCNRVGDENGFTFIGKSKIVAPSGTVLAAAEGAESIIVADLNLDDARTKRTVTIPGTYETDVIGLRRPDIYSL